MKNMDSSMFLFRTIYIFEQLSQPTETQSTATTKGEHSKIPVKMDFHYQ